ncbi:hypothetical protein ACIPPQ_19000 [Sphingopyxis sp. LARHCG72]
MTAKDDDIAYFRRRLEACEAQAARATTDGARNAHRTLAGLYREKLVWLGRAEFRTKTDPF